MIKATEMELRVAKALHPSWFEPESKNGLVGLGETDWPTKAIENARKAIRAMREPTKEMIALGNDKIEYDLDQGWPSTGPTVEILPSSARDAWHAMIDAALSP